jgi:hypothetical protein
LLQLIIAQLWIGFVGYLTVAAMLDDGTTFEEAWAAVNKDEFVWLALAAWLVGTVCTIIVMRAANDLKRFRRYHWVVAGAILTFLSVPLIYLGVIQVPLSVWLLVLLLRRDVRARFEAVAREKASGAA